MIAFVLTLLDYLWCCLMPIPSRHFKSGYCRAPLCGSVATLGYCAIHLDRRWLYG